MNQAKVRNRYVVIAGTTRVKKNSGYREPTSRPTAERIVVIRNGEVVAGGRGR